MTFFWFSSSFHFFDICSNGVEQLRFWCRAVFLSRWISSSWPFSIKHIISFRLKSVTIAIKTEKNRRKQKKLCSQGNWRKLKKTEENICSEDIEDFFYVKQCQLFIKLFNALTPTSSMFFTSLENCQNTKYFLFSKKAFLAYLLWYACWNLYIFFNYWWSISKINSLSAIVCDQALKVTQFIIHLIQIWKDAFN